MTKTHGTIEAHLYAALEEKIEKYAKKAQRLGLAAPVLTKIGETTELQHRTNAYGERTQIAITIVEYEIEGKVPRVEGWTFLGAIEHFEGDDGTPQMLFKKPFLIDREVENLQQYLLPKCDHCNTNRTRAKTVLLENEAGEIKQVGKACLGNFVGGDFAVWEDDDDEANWDADESALYQIRKTALAIEMLVLTAATVRLCGWTSKGAAQDQRTEPTAVKVEEWLFQRRPPMRNAEVTDDDIAKGKTVLAWVEAADAENNYFQNLKAVLTNAWVDKKKIGLVASAIAAYDKHLVWEREKAERAALEAAANAGREECPEGKVEIAGVVLKATVHENDFGQRLVITVLDDRGFKVWGTNPKGQYGVGDRLTFTAEVTQARDDKHFGYFKRPSKVVLIASATAAA